MLCYCSIFKSPLPQIEGWFGVWLHSNIAITLILRRRYSSTYIVERFLLLSSLPVYLCNIDFFRVSCTHLVSQNDTFVLFLCNLSFGNRHHAIVSKCNRCDCYLCRVSNSFWLSCGFEIVCTKRTFGESISHWWLSHYFRAGKSIYGYHVEQYLTYLDNCTFDMYDGYLWCVRSWFWMATTRYRSIWRWRAIWQGHFPPLNRRWYYANLRKMVLASHVLWSSSVSVVRIGLLFYYRKLFSTRTFRMADTIVIILSVLWWITAILVSSKSHLENSGYIHGVQYLISNMWDPQTTTISFTWNPQFQQAQFSINFFGWMIAATALNISLDIATLALPVFVIGNLKLNKKKKIMVSGIFTLGIL